MSSDVTAARKPVAHHAEVLVEEAALVAHAKRDRAAFAPLYAHYFDPIYRYCYRRLGNADAAADATSQVFAKALTALHTCREESFRSWLFAIAHNVLVDRFRERRPDAPLDAADAVVDPSPSPEDQAIAGDQRRQIVHLLAQLPPDQRRVVELRLAGLTATEIATALGRNRGAIDTAQCRAVQRLRQLLGITGAATTEVRHAAG
jgi:RNA polymerase sigma-70 factor (ECF subfamily)